MSREVPVEASCRLTTMDFEEKVEQRNNPRETSGWLSLTFFWWMNSLLVLGHRRELQLEDLHRPSKEDQSEVLGDRLEEEWRRELLAAKEGTRKKPSLARALMGSFGRRYALLGIFTGFEECVLRIYQPLFMGR